MNAVQCIGIFTIQDLETYQLQCGKPAVGRDQHVAERAGWSPKVDFQEAIIVLGKSSAGDGRNGYWIAANMDFWSSTIPDTQLLSAGINTQFLATDKDGFNRFLYAPVCHGQLIKRLATHANSVPFGTSILADLICDQDHPTYRLFVDIQIRRYGPEILIAGHSHYVSSITSRIIDATTSIKQDIYPLTMGNYHKFAEDNHLEVD